MSRMCLICFTNSKDHNCSTKSKRIFIAKMSFKRSRLFPSLALLVLIQAARVVNGQATLLNSTVFISRDPNDVHFYHYPDPRNVTAFNEITYNDTTSLLASGLRSNAKTVFITHGFRSNVTSDMPQTVKNAFLASGLGYNVIIVSWGELSTPQPPELTSDLYAFAARNIFVVAQRLTDFILFLEEQKQLTLSDVYLVGHSLGAHTSGLVGRNIFLQTGRKIPRITGLDPAGPAFYPPRPETNLGKEDADFVDVIHTNMFTLGIWTRSGHADFYPNGGYNQPNCNQGPESDIGQFPGRCSHWYSYRIFAASLTRRFPSCLCRSPFMASYAFGLCPSFCLPPFQVTLGFHCPKTARGEYYLTPPNPL